MRESLGSEKGGKGLRLKSEERILYLVAGWFLLSYLQEGVEAKFQECKWQGGYICVKGAGLGDFC